MVPKRLRRSVESDSKHPSAIAPLIAYPSICYHIASLLIVSVAGGAGRTVGAYAPISSTSPTRAPSSAIPSRWGFHLDFF